MAGKAKVSSFTASRMPLACRWLHAPPQRMGTNGPRSSRCWRAYTSAQATVADRAHGSRYWRRIKAMTPKIFAIDSENGGFDPRFLNGWGRPQSRVDAP